MAGLRSTARRIWLRHGEKILIGLGAVTFLHALFATSWRGYERDPQQARAVIAAAEEQMAVTTWPAAERERFRLAEGTAVADLVQRRLRTPIDAGLYFTAQHFHHRLGAEQRPLTEPELFPVQELLASSERVLLPQFPITPVVPIEDEAPEPARELIPDEFLRPRAGRSVGTRVGRVDRRGQPRTAIPKQASAPLAEGHGYPYVAVRGCVDLPQQVRAYMDAIHASFARSEDALEIIDFELERQRQVTPSNWSAWQPVDRDVYFDVLRRTGRLAHDVVSAHATDSAITAPLPARLTGIWNRQSTHPRLADYDLTSDELAQELRYLQALNKRAAAAQQSQSRLTKRGFADLVPDSFGLRQSVFGQPDAPTRSRPQSRLGSLTARPASRVDQIVQELTRELDPQRADPQLIDWIRARATAQRRMLLFRYLDFDVVPGETYRYRVRLEVRNPNFRRSLGLASSASVVEGATRFTPWSEPTAAVEVEPLATYFVTSLTPARRRAGVEARMQIYQYDVETGTTMEQTFQIHCGQSIGGAARTTRPNPVKGLVEEGIYDFRTAYRLVDGMADPELSPGQHPDLRLPADSRGRAFLANVYVVSGRRSDVQVLDTVTQSDDFDQQKLRMEWQSSQLQSLLRAGSRYDEFDEPGREFDL